jgi:hypothetical protein
MSIVPKALRGKNLRKRLQPAYWPIHPKYWQHIHQPRVVYIIGLPRTGSTLMKRYMGEFPSHFEIAPFGEYQQAWLLAEQHPNRIIIDKKTGNLSLIEQIYLEYGNQVRFAAIVRDPRDELVSLVETERHPEIPKDEAFWQFWLEKYQAFLDFAQKHARRGMHSALIRYEDLVRRPAAAKRDFVAWLNIDVQSVEFTRHYTSTVESIAQGTNLSEDWKVHQTNSVHADSVGRWQVVANPATADQVSRYRQHPGVVDLMRALGYGDTLGELRGFFPGVTFLGNRDTQ